ncbi:alpha-L-fucosidase [Aurantibacter sp.]|uniref:alpha-L-fucosidase n=1 Tax=Aurantibacter sp. TaxID=2807103 RepID=UPI00326657C8
MKLGYKFFVSVIFLLVLVSCGQVEPPQPIEPLPSKRQLAWHDMKYYAFVHFNMNTFTDMEWGTGGESPEQFNPTELDTRQWAKVAKDAGMTGIIITAKHHDGFCLWPTKTTEHSVKNSPWKDGKGDLLKDLSEACKEYGLKFGVYLSPWDRNAANYGTPEYVADFHEQLREILTNYGEVFEVWFDGANGGSGYYGGANETRKIDNKTYYQWDKTQQIVRELQPNAVIFSDGGPDIRWVGTEEGWANETNWSIMRRDEIYPGWPRYVELRSGHADGTHWLPAEVNTSIRPGWYYHAREDHQVKSLERLVRTYYESIGRNGNFLLNLPVDKRGLVHEKDVEQLNALKTQIDKDFEHELAIENEIIASNYRGNSAGYKPENAIDGNPETYWATDDEVTSAELVVKFEEPTEVNRLVLQEYIPLGQRIQHFIVEAEVNGEWIEIDGQTTVGNRRILQFKTVEVTQLKVDFKKAKGPIVISNLEIYRAPNFLVAPKISRNIPGMVSITIPDSEVSIYYTLDGSIPTEASNRYETPFLINTPTTLKVVAVDPKSKAVTEPKERYFDISKEDWSVINSNSGDPTKTNLIIDENPNTYWMTDSEVKHPQEVVIDLGNTYAVKGFTYWPSQDRYPMGIITEYEFSTSLNGGKWKKVASGEFSNIVNSRIAQTIEFDKTKARYIKLRGVKVDPGASHEGVLKDLDFRTSFAEIDIITEK